jgi:hypothetical protein
MSIRARLVFGWALVGIPLAYGVYQTLVKTASLFTGWTDRRVCRSEADSKAVVRREPSPGVRHVGG